MKISFGKAILAGIIGTLVMTAAGLWAAPMMGIPPMNPADMLAQQMGGSPVFGWSGHLMIGIILAVIYAGVSPRLAGPFPIRGALFGLALPDGSAPGHAHDGNAALFRLAATGDRKPHRPPDLRVRRWSRVRGRRAENRAPGNRRLSWSYRPYP